MLSNLKTTLIYHCRNYGLNWGHSFFQFKVLSFTVLISILLHFLVLFFPITPKKTIPSNVSYEETLNVVIKNIGGNRISITSSTLSNSSSLQDPANTKERKTVLSSPDLIPGVVLGGSTQFGIDSPASPRAFSRSNQHLRAKIESRKTANLRFREMMTEKPPMKAIWEILRNSQQYYGGGNNLTCVGGETFVCRPENQKLAKFLESQWAIMRMSYPTMPPLELKRTSGYWRIHKVYKSHNHRN